MDNFIKYKKLKDLREDHDLTQKQVGEMLNISQRGYSHYEKGEYDLTGEILIKLASIYNTSTDYILGLTTETKPYPQKLNSKNKN